MWIQVRTMDGKKALRLDGLSKLTKIEDLREKLVQEFDAPVEQQRLFYRGKQLVDGHSLFDYDVGLNEIIQLMVRKLPVAASPALGAVTNSIKENNAEGGHSSGDESCSSNKENVEPQEPEEMEVADDTDVNTDSTYKMGDIIDAKDVEMGAWFEAELVKITRKPSGRTSPKTSESQQSTQNDTQKETDLNANVTKDSDENSTQENNNNSKDESPSVDKESSTSRTSESQNKENENSDNVTASSTNASTDKKCISPVPEGLDQDDGFLYHVIYEGYEEDPPVALPVFNVRPRARHKVKLDNAAIGSRVMVNHNYDEPTTRGYWYDAVVTGKRNTRTIKELICTVFIGKDLIPMENCKVCFVDEIFELEQPGTQLNKNDQGAATQTPTKRVVKAKCEHCLDNVRRKCKFCGCHECGGKDAESQQVMCDECDCSYHLWCLTPPLTEVPEEEEWYCPKCKVDKSEVVLAGEKLKESKKKSRMASASSTTTRDWGRGMACVGRTKKCNIVPSNHYGPIPGVEVGTVWKFRVQVSEAGVHRPHVAGIHGREVDGAYSIVLSGGYEDDKDDGDQFTYTGSGGRDLSGNKRTAEQSCDQLLTRMNMALARNCNAPVDKKKGAEAKDWKGGKAVRVVRNFKGSAHSKYAPTEGNRYDGIYKIVKYWPSKGKSGFLVWRYLLRRDDPTAAPWTKEGKKRIEKLGLEMQYPEGWLESQKAKEDEKEEGKGKTPKGKGKGKRKRVESDSEEETESPVKKKKLKKASYEVDEDIAACIKEDDQNRKLWDEALSHTSEGAQKFIAKVEELFVCICCQDLAFKPITTTCSHNVCKPCLQRSFKAEVFNCPACRTDLGQNMKMEVNKPLGKALNGLFPGYENGR